jgi:hypothetical protein
MPMMDFFFVCYFTLLSISQIIHRGVVWWQMNDEFEIILKEAGVVLFRYYSSICLEKLSRNLSLKTRCPSRDSNWTPPDYKSSQWALPFCLLAIMFTWILVVVTMWLPSLATSALGWLTYNHRALEGNLIVGRQRERERAFERRHHPHPKDVFRRRGTYFSGCLRIK